MGFYFHFVFSVFACEFIFEIMLTDRLFLFFLKNVSLNLYLR
jgi:hypothetical protein